MFGGISLGFPETIDKLEPRIRRLLKKYNFEHACRKDGDRLLIGDKGSGIISVSMSDVFNRVGVTNYRVGVTTYAPGADPNEDFPETFYAEQACTARQLTAIIKRSTDHLRSWSGSEEVHSWISSPAADTSADLATRDLAEPSEAISRELTALGVCRRRSAPEQRPFSLYLDLTADMELRIEVLDKGSYLRDHGYRGLVELRSRISHKESRLGVEGGAYYEQIKDLKGMLAALKRASVHIQSLPQSSVPNKTTKR